MAKQYPVVVQVKPRRIRKGQPFTVLVNQDPETMDPWSLIGEVLKQMLDEIQGIEEICVSPGTSAISKRQWPICERKEKFVHIERVRRCKEFLAD
jgi:hypothetical protein